MRMRRELPQNGIARGAHRRPRPTVAVLFGPLDPFGGGCEGGLRGAAGEGRRGLGLGPLLIHRPPLAHPDPAEATHNAIYELIHGQHVDGLVTLSPALSTY